MRTALHHLAVSQSENASASVAMSFLPSSIIFLYFLSRLIASCLVRRLISRPSGSRHEDIRRDSLCLRRMCEARAIAGGSLRVSIASFQSSRCF